MNTTTIAAPKTIEEIRAEAEQKIAEKVKMARELAEISLLTNEKFQEALVKQQLRDISTNKLTSLIAQCEQIVTDNPQINRALRQQRTFNPSRRYGYGNQYALLSGLLSGIQYSIAVHAELMHEITGLSPDLIETTLQYQGDLPYFNENYQQVVTGTCGNAQALYDNVLIIESILGITIDKSLITQANMDRQYALALAKADKAHEESLLANSVQDFILK